MKSKIIISKATIDRLPVYYRALRQLECEDIEIISSEELGKKIGITPEQIRKDLALFGEFGKKGVGYYVQELMVNISEILGLHKNWNVAIVGIGRLGTALAYHKQFKKLGFNIIALYDSDNSKVGKSIAGVTIEHTDKIQNLKEKDIQIGIITVSIDGAQIVADKLVAAGIKGIWNFAPTKINVTDKVKIINEDLSVGLSSISYYLSRDQDK